MAISTALFGKLKANACRFEQMPSQDQNAFREIGRLFCERRVSNTWHALESKPVNHPQFFAGRVYRVTPDTVYGVWKKDPPPATASRNPANPETLGLGVTVISYAPATIVFWADKTKTVVKCTEDDTYSFVYGYLLAFFIKYSGRTHTQAAKHLNWIRRDRLTEYLTKYFVKNSKLTPNQARVHLKSL